jgi:hypothetical protein
MIIHAHFDGNVIVPDEPLDLRPNQQLLLRITEVAPTGPSDRGSALDWLASNALDADDDLPEDLAERHDNYLYDPLVEGQSK